MTTPDTEGREVQVGDRVICDGLSTGKIGKVLGVGSSEHSIKLLIEGVERYEPDYALLEVTAKNKRAVELLLSHYSLLTSRDTYWKERVEEFKRKAAKSFIGSISDAQPSFDDPQSAYIESSFFHALNHSAVDIFNEDNLK